VTCTGELSKGVDGAAEQPAEASEASGFEPALDGTLYWTLSVYLKPELVAERRGDKDGQIVPVSADEFRKWQLKHPTSFALRNAIDPLFNDIADRERLGKVQDFLFAAGPMPEPKSSGLNLGQAAHELRRQKMKLRFELPA
jgi:hypothetical protein